MPFVFRFEVTDGKLPEGLSLDTATGILAGEFKESVVERQIAIRAFAFKKDSSAVASIRINIDGLLLPVLLFSVFSLIPVLVSFSLLYVFFSCFVWLQIRLVGCLILPPRSISMQDCI